MKNKKDYLKSHEVPVYTLNCEKCGKPFVSVEAFPVPQICYACKGEAEAVPTHRQVMQPTVINQSNPIDLNYLYQVVCAKGKADFGFPGMTDLMNKVTKLGDAFMEDAQPGSGFFAKAQVDILTIEVLDHVLRMIHSRGIDLEVVLKAITLPKGIVTTVADKNSFDGERMSNKFTADEEGQTKQYPMRPEECLSPEDVIDPENE